MSAIQTIYLKIVLKPNLLILLCFKFPVFFHFITKHFFLIYLSDSDSSFSVMCLVHNMYVHISKCDAVSLFSSEE